MKGIVAQDNGTMKDMEGGYVLGGNREGSWLEGKRHGKGVDRGGAVYGGDFKNDFKERYGVYR